MIDEVQRNPDLLLAIKTAVDDDRPRRPGRFVLTGSANLLLMRRVNESLAGRAVYLTLHPLTRREQLGLGSAGIWQSLLDTPVARWRDLVEAETAPDEDWRALVRRGGYPPAAYDLRDDEERALWFEGYVATYRICSRGGTRRRRRRSSGTGGRRRGTRWISSSSMTASSSRSR